MALGSAANRCTPQLLLLLQQADSNIRSTALRAFGAIGKDATLANTQVIAQCIGDENEDVQIAAVEVLGSLGEVMHIATHIPSILVLLDSPQDAVRKAAMQLLWLLVTSEPLPPNQQLEGGHGSFGLVPLLNGVVAYEAACQTLLAPMFLGLASNALASARHYQQPMRRTGFAASICSSEDIRAIDDPRAVVCTFLWIHQEVDNPVAPKMIESAQVVP